MHYQGYPSTITVPTGGQGGGGNSGTEYSSYGPASQDGAANTGGGAAGRDFWNNAQPGRVGGSGVVILKIANANFSNTYTGSPTKDTSSVTGYTILKFTGSGTYTV